MSPLDRILPWQRNRARRTWLAGETLATREALVAHVSGLARAMEERFVSLSERIDDARGAQAAETARLADMLGQVQATLDAGLESLATQVSALRDGQEFARVLRDLKRDLGAQISLSSFEAATEIQALASCLERPASDTPTPPARG